MKKWIYLIVPTILLAGFIVIYLGHVEKTEAKERAHKEQVAREKAAAEEKKRIAEAKAREDAKKRQDEREAEEARKQKEKDDKQAADDKKVRDQTAEYLAKAKAVQAEIDKLEAELNRLRAEKDKTTRENFDLAKQVELARIARRNAELEIQRITEMINRRASESYMVRPPIAAAPPAKSS